MAHWLKPTQFLVNDTEKETKPVPCDNTPKLLLVVLNLERCVIGRNASFPGEHVKEVMQKKPTRILLAVVSPIISG